MEQCSLVLKHTNGPDNKPCHVYIVGAHWIEPMHSWGMTFKRDGVLMDHRQSDDPWLEGREWINEQIQSEEDVVE